MKFIAGTFAYALFWACAFGFALVVGLMPKLIGDSGSLGALLTQPVQRHWLLNTFEYTFTGRHLALYVLFGLVFGILHLLICAGLGGWKVFKLSLLCRNLIAGAALGMSLGGLYSLYAHSSPSLNDWCALLIVLTFIGTGGVVGLLQGRPPPVRLRTDLL